MKGWNLRDAADQAVTRSQDLGAGSWMTAAQFSEWSERHFPARRRIGDAMEQAVGLSKQAARRRREGDVKVSKQEALACAHYAMGFPMPAPAGDVEAFSRWFAARFVTAYSVNAWLELGGGAITHCLRGFVLRDGSRFEALPDATLIRALDWVWRVGPVVPWFEGDAP